MTLEHNRKKTEKKLPGHIKDELLDSLVSIEKIDEGVLNSAVRNGIDPKEGVSIIKEFG